ncbi:MAG: type II secretion system protein [Armatimonadota bacterium]
MSRQHAAGFTLVELLVVIAIVAMIAAILLPVFLTMGRRVNQHTCLNNLHAIGVALAQYRDDYGAYPDAPMPSYLKAGKAADIPFSQRPGVAKPTFTGTGLNDMTSGGSFTGNTTMTYRVYITLQDPMADKFQWSDDGGTTWNGTDIDITGGAQTLNNGVQITFSATTGHDLGDLAKYWEFVAGPIPTNWVDWRRQPTAKITDDPQVAAGSTDVTVDDPASFTDGMRVVIRGSGVSEVAIIDTIAGNTLTLRTGLLYDHPKGDTIDPGFQYQDVDTLNNVRYGNYGLAKLFQLYLTDTRDYLRNRQLYHCPAITATEGVDRSATLNKVDEATEFRTFDPLWAGYNTYDVTYNYDQFYDEILAFDGVIGSGQLNAPRQLFNANVPADTVICWCYGHLETPTPSYLDPTKPAFTLDTALVSTPEAQRDLIQANEKLHRSESRLVLWIDGTVDVAHPYLMPGRAVGGQIPYYWVPPFLYSKGDWRK